jgi:DNA repair protein RecN (Recombination protein N)
MLKYLRISNLAVISDIEIECEAGLNLLTGETGSGKSIIVDALSLLLGARASQEMIRSGESRGYVEGVFHVDADAGRLECLTEAGIEAPTGEIIIRRELQRDGPARAFVNDRLVTVSLLKDLRPQLIDIHGQGDHQSLLLPSVQLRLLDSLGEALEIREQLNRVFLRYRQKKEELDTLSRTEAERWRLVDVYQFQISEIERINPQTGEDEELEKQRRVLHQAEKLARLTQQSYERLYEADDSILTVEAQVRRWIQELCQIDDQFKDVIELLDRAKVGLEESAFFLREYQDEFVASPDRLQQVEDRLAELHRLKRKYGPSLEEVIANLVRMKEQLHQLSSSDEHRAVLEKELADVESQYYHWAEILTEQRTAAARRLEQQVVREMKDLAMEHGRLMIEFQPVNNPPVESGVERIEFLVALNPGEELKPLSRVASGGEMSRLMLAIKSVAAADAGAPILIFDEIDVGIGGRVAERVGLRLKQLAQAHQVFCVTHLPQIARFAQAHYRVEKQVSGGRAVVAVEKLDRTGRVNELARMMAGAQITDVTRRHARELLQAARS